MNLTTLARVKTLLEVKGDTLDTVLKQIIRSVSKAIENSALFDRYIERKLRTEYFDTDYAQPIVSVKGVPIDEDTAPLIYHDTAREFATGTLIDAGNYYVQAARGIIKFDRYTLSEGKGSLKIVYTGGLSESTDRMVVTISSIVGTFTVGETVTGGTGGATGTVVSIDVSNLTMTVDVLTGEFELDETITGGTSNATCVIDAITQNPIVMAYPDLAHACEIQAGFIQQRRNTLGQKSVSLEGGSVSTFQTLKFLPEVRQILNTYRRFGDIS